MKASDYLFAATKFVSKKDPFQVTYFVTGKCNAKCGHCFYWEELNQRKNELSLDEVKAISKSMPRFFSLILTGGEPFMRPDVADIAKVFYDNNKARNLGMPTNALLTDRVYNSAKKILDTCPELLYTVSISLDGIEEDHDIARGVPGNFKKVVETYRKILPLKMSYKNFNVNFLCCVSKRNQHKLKAINDYVKKEFGADVTMIMTRGNPKDPRSKEVDIENYDLINELQKDKFKDIDSFNHPKLKIKIRERMHKIRTQLISKTIKENRYFIPCQAAKLELVIDEVGQVYPCEILSKTLGNLRDYGLDFRKLWENEEADRIRSFIKDTKCFCTHECQMRTNIMFNAKVMLGGKIA